MLSPCLRGFNCQNPANPLIAGKRCNIFPFYECGLVREKGFFQISGDWVRYSTRDSFFGHVGIIAGWVWGWGERCTERIWSRVTKAFG